MIYLPTSEGGAVGEDDAGLVRSWMTNFATGTPMRASVGRSPDLDMGTPVEPSVSDGLRLVVVAGGIFLLDVGTPVLPSVSDRSVGEGGRNPDLDMGTPVLPSVGDGLRFINTGPRSAGRTSATSNAQHTKPSHATLSFFLSFLLLSFFLFFSFSFSSSSSSHTPLSHHLTQHDAACHTYTETVRKVDLGESRNNRRTWTRGHPLCAQSSD